MSRGDVLNQATGARLNINHNVDGSNLQWNFQLNRDGRPDRDILMERFESRRRNMQVIGIRWNIGEAEGSLLVRGRRLTKSCHNILNFNSGTANDASRRIGDSTGDGSGTA
jgi:hypothetical protein